MEERYTCPQCGKPFSFVRHDVIDTGKEPAMKEKVRSGEPFTFPVPPAGGIPISIIPSFTGKRIPIPSFTMPIPGNFTKPPIIA